MQAVVHFTAQELKGRPGLFFDAIVYLYEDLVGDESFMTYREIAIWLEDTGGDVVPIDLGPAPENHWLAEAIYQEVWDLAATKADWVD